MWVDTCNSVGDYRYVSAFFYVTLDYYLIARPFVVISLRAQPPGYSPAFELKPSRFYTLRQVGEHNVQRFTTASARV